MWPKLMESKNVREIKKTNITFEAKVVRRSLVSKQQKLCASRQQNGQPSANAALNGPQGRMAPVKPSQS